MRGNLAALLLLALALPAWAQSPLVAELRVWATRYHENPQKIDELRAALEQAAQANADLDTLLALSQACFIYGDVRAKTPEEKLEAYDRGRQVAKRAVELAPRSAAARFWYGANTGRWGQTKGVMRSVRSSSALYFAASNLVRNGPMRTRCQTPRSGTWAARR